MAQLWAGTKWGGVYVPRIGQEVIVDFLEGDPDRPIIIGCVYNAINPPPYEDGKTSGIKSNTTKGGGGYNEISMTDTKNEEAITIHAQKDMNTTVENDQSVTLKSGNRTITVESGTCTETSSGDLSITSNDGAVKITGKGQGVSIQGDSEGVKVGGTGQGVVIEGKGGDGVQVSGNPNLIALGESEVRVWGADVIIQGDSSVFITGKEVSIEGDSSVTISAGGSSVKIDAAGVKASGAKVDLNP